ncbi:hypothetical protein G7Y89_g3598 [Cudoniella acicularis]|uniref:beta-glucosidase n=1 Tax=Cudoniella acicularis TaxID=354080 RepID=A0A8H4W7H4_9HELO|nr:hypothetical protein G7Y89_g3598 [Cudoniella acicularis]
MSASHRIEPGLERVLTREYSAPVTSSQALQAPSSHNKLVRSGTNRIGKRVLQPFHENKQNQDPGRGSQRAELQSSTTSQDPGRGQQRERAEAQASKVYQDPGRGPQRERAEPQASTAYQDPGRSSQREREWPSTTVNIKDNELRAALEESHEDIRDLELRLEEATTALALLAHQTDPFRLDDGVITSARKQLQNDIRQWSKHFHHSARTGIQALRKGQEVPWCNITPDYKHYLGDSFENGPSLLVQSYVWQTLQREIFGCYAWAGRKCLQGGNCSLYKAFKNLNEAVSPYVKDATPPRIKNYHHWRAQSARLTATSPSRHPECIEKNIQTITNKMASQLKGYTDEKDIFGDNERNKGAFILASIVRAAVDLDRHIWQQKANFQWHGAETTAQLEGRARFDPAWMEPVSITREEDLVRARATARLFCAPALIKCGTSEGDNYDQELVICRAVVDCSEAVYCDTQHTRSSISCMEVTLEAPTEVRRLLFEPSFLNITMRSTATSLLTLLHLGVGVLGDASSNYTSQFLSSVTIKLGDWQAAYDKANALVQTLSTTEKLSIITGGDRGNFSSLAMLDSSTNPLTYFYVTTWPAGMSMAISWDKEAIQGQGKALGLEFRGKGINLAYAPTLEPLGR